MRHGEYDRETGSLTYNGESQVKETGKILAKKLKGLKEIIVYHSPAQRAKESALVLSETLNSLNKAKVKLKRAEELACDEYNVETIVNKIATAGIIVGHKPDLESFLENQGIDTSLNTAEFYELK